MNTIIKIKVDAIWQWPSPPRTVTVIAYESNPRFIIAGTIESIGGNEKRFTKGDKINIGVHSVARFFRESDTAKIIGSSFDIELQKHESHPPHMLPVLISN